MNVLRFLPHFILAEGHGEGRPQQPFRLFMAYQMQITGKLNHANQYINTVPHIPTSRYRLSLTRK